MALVHYIFVLSSSVFCLTFLKPCFGDGGQADDCTNGFISLERMRRVFDNQLVAASTNSTAIFPGINFTCNGTIQSLTIGANYRGGSRTLFPEIQLWRPVVGQAGLYTLVNNISYNLTHRINEEFRYRIEGDPLLEFQQGDIIGYYQPAEEDSLSRLLLARCMPQPVQTMYYRDGNPNSEFEVDVGDNDFRNLLVSATSECIGGGFLSEETLRTLIGLEGVGRLINRNARQQITPDINFTCHGTITKWIVGALINNNNMISGPTLQLWRNTGGDNYTKLNETNVTSVADNSSLIYEFTDFTPIPFQPGDVLGISVPRIGDTILRLRFESNYGPINYYTTDLIPVSEIKLSELSNQTYNPLVSLEISIVSQSKNPSDTRTTVQELSPMPTSQTLQYYSVVETVKSFSITFSLHSASPVQSSLFQSPNSQDDMKHNNIPLGVVGVTVGISVSIAITLLIAILISVILCLRQRRKKKLITFQNVSYQYSTTVNNTSTEQYGYVSIHRLCPSNTTEDLIISNNEEYKGDLSENMAYGKLEGELSENMAYGKLEGDLSENMAYGKLEGELSENVAYGTLEGELSENVAYGKGMEMSDNVAYTSTTGGGGKEYSTNEYATVNPPNVTYCTIDEL